MSGPTILVADDDASVRLVISQTLAQEGYHVRATNTMSALWRWIQAGEGDLLITDVYMPDESIFDLLPQIRRTRPELPIIVISAQSTVLTAAMASDHGAYDYLPKPFDIDKLAETVRRALQRKPTRGQETSGRRAEKDEALPLIGRSKPMQAVYRVIARVMNNDLPVLIEGESGSGKDLAARAIHQLGKRKTGPFVAVSLAALQREQVEDELFGGGRDSNGKRRGKVSEADGGTLFLDEVGDMPLEAQTRLVRFLQDGRFATRSTSPFTFSRSSSPSDWMMTATPVGPRYSPKDSRSAAPHSPTVTPAFAAAIEGGMMLAPDAAAARSSPSASATASLLRCDRQAFSLAIWRLSAPWSCAMMEPSPPESGLASVVS